MTRHKTLFLVNPALIKVAPGDLWISFDRWLKNLVEQIGSVPSTPTHATVLAQEAAEEGYQLVIAAGGWHRALDQWIKCVPFDSTKPGDRTGFRNDFAIDRDTLQQQKL
jgi:hypothetical protein